MIITVTDHALDRARERILSSLERTHRTLSTYLVHLWSSGTIEEWADPDDPPGAVTVTSEVPPAWDSDPCLGPRYLVGRKHHDGRIAIISALTADQYEHNARCRWGEPGRPLKVGP